MNTEHYLECSNNEQVCTKRLFLDVRDSFTYELLIKPEAMYEIRSESESGTGGIHGQRYIISPEHAGNPNEAGIGICVGTNGISVYEHTDHHLAPILVYSSHLHDWLNITVVFMNKTPHLYLNGTFIKRGLTSIKNHVIASGIFGGHKPYGYFKGKVKYIKLWNYARTEQEIQLGTTLTEQQYDRRLIGYWQFQSPAYECQSFKHPLHHLRQKGILFIMNNIGGGTAHYLDIYLEQIRGKARIYLLNYETNEIIIQDLNHTHALSYIFPLTSNSLASFIQLLNLLEISKIFVNHLIHFPLSIPTLFKIMRLIQDSGVDYVYYSQDFFCACPLVNLLNKFGVYCNDETNVHICQACVKSRYDVSIKHWRSMFASFLKNAKQVCVASESTKHILNKYYPDIHIQVNPLPIPSTVRYTFDPSFATEPVLNIAFIGNIQYNKGSNILYELATIIRRQKLPVTITVIGTTDRHHSFQSHDGKLTITGPYNNAEVSQQLALYHISIVVISSICPETFSYTTSEAMKSGYPVITFNIGATAEKVQESKGGWIASNINANSLVHILKQLLADRNIILEKASILAALYKN